MKLSQKEMAVGWVMNGGDPQKADEFSAIMMPESGGDSKIDNGICCVGLAQLNVRDGIATRKCAENVNCSIRRSIQLSNNGKDWTPWQAYTEGKHKPYLGKSGIDTSNLRNMKTGTQDCQPLGGSSLTNAGAGALAGAAAGTIVPGAGNLAGAAIGGAIGGAGGLIGGNVLGGCSPLKGANPLSGLDQLAAAVEAIARLIENLFTAHFWVRFGKGLLGALLIVYALQGVLRATLGIEIPIGAINSKLGKMHGMGGS